MTARATAPKTPSPRVSRKCTGTSRKIGLGAEGRQQERDDDGEAAGSLRRCILTRVERDPADLLRFVADPAGRLVPDLSRKLPGRGVWVTADKATRRRRGGDKSLRQEPEARGHGRAGLAADGRSTIC